MKNHLLLLMFWRPLLPPFVALCSPWWHLAANGNRPKQGSNDCQSITTNW